MIFTRKDLTLVLDIGNVVLPIDYNRTVQSFSRHTPANIESMLTLHQQTIIFDQFERGEFCSSMFRKKVSELFGLSVSDELFDSCWNDLLLPVPEENVQYLSFLRRHYRVVALSNINEIHAHALDHYAINYLNISSFRDLFHKVYYSYEHGFRKPEIGLYQLLQQQENSEGKNILFIDDKKENVESARALGWNAEQLTRPEDFVDVLNRFLGATFAG